MGFRNRKKNGNVALYWLMSMALLAGLLILPARAVWAIGSQIQPAYVIAYVLGVTLVTFYTFRADKRRAVAGDWRISEGRLHVMELLGGWPAGFIAQRVYRHKTAKVTYQIPYWIIVLVHQYVSVEYVQQWTWSA